MWSVWKSVKIMKKKSCKFLRNWYQATLLVVTSLVLSLFAVKWLGCNNVSCVFGILGTLLGLKLLNLRDRNVITVGILCCSTNYNRIRGFAGVMSEIRLLIVSIITINGNSSYALIYILCETYTTDHTTSYTHFVVRRNFNSRRTICSLLLLQHFVMWWWTSQLPHLPATYVLVTTVAHFTKTRVLFPPLGMWSNLSYSLCGELNCYSALTLKSPN